MVSRALRRGPAILITFVVLAVVALNLRPTQSTPDWLAVLGSVVPVILLVAAIVEWFAGRAVGSLAAALAGLSWAGLTWTAASVSSPDPLMGFGMVLAPFLVPWLVLQLAELPTPWRPVRAMSALTVIAFVGIGLAGVVRALVYEPFLDLHCGPFCGHSPVLVVSIPGLAAILGAAATWVTVLVCGSTGLAVLIRFVRVPLARVRGRAAAGLVVGAMAALTSAAMLGLIRTAVPPTPSGTASVIALQSGACVAVAIAAILVAADRLAVRRRLAEVARLLGAQSEPLALQAILRRAVGDPDLRVGYWTDDIGYVGADGLPLEEPRAPRHRTELTSRGRRVAAVIHDAGSLPSDLLDEHLGSQARLAVQNESLQLQLRRRVDELRASRRRIVEIGDEERRGLERDLHDGAQQLLLALMFELRRGERAAANAGDVNSTAAFVRAREAASTTLEQLRSLAHGIHPGILTGAGLEEALISYARTVTPPPALMLNLAGRLPARTEATVYAIVTGLVEALPGRTVAIRQDGDSVRILVEGRGDAPEYVLDRLGAAGGSSVTAEHRLELVLPCA